MSNSAAESPGPAASDVNYQPLSKLAIIGLGLAGMYVVIVVANAVVAWLQNAAAFLWIGLLLLPLAGASLCLLAQRQIRNSEGTLAGEKLTQWGLWLSVIGGLGYGAFYLATGMAVQQQADRFLLVKDEDSGFFAHLLEGDVNRAFLLTLPWQQRRNVSPDDAAAMQKFLIPLSDKDTKGLLGQFLDSQTVHMIIQAGREGKKIQSLGAKLWKFENGEYFVERNYRIETNELIQDITIPVKSNDTEAADESRKWTVVWNQVTPVDNPRRTELGKSLQKLRYSASDHYFSWARRLQNGTLEKFQAKDVTNWNTLGQPEEVVRSALNKELKAVFSGEDKNPREMIRSQAKYIPWKDNKGHIQFIFTFFFKVPRFSSGDVYLAETRVIVESAEPIDPLKQDESAEWELKTIEVLRYNLIPDLPK